MVELALAMPLFIVVLFGVILLGLAVFYHQQVENAAREAARYAAIHSATSQCPTEGWKLPQGGNKPLTYVSCDRASEGWPFLTEHARGRVFGFDSQDLSVSACWSGYQESSGAYDAQPRYDHDNDPSTPDIENSWTPCTMWADTDGDGAADATVDPIVGIDQLGCPAIPTNATNDTGSNIPNNHVTVFTCFEWQPPMGGLAIPLPGNTSITIIPSTIAMKAAITEVIQRQQ